MVFKVMNCSISLLEILVKKLMPATMKVQNYRSSSTTKLNLRGSYPCALSGTPIWTMHEVDRVTEVPNLENYSCILKS